MFLHRLVRVEMIESTVRLWATRIIASVEPFDLVVPPPRSLVRLARDESTTPSDSRLVVGGRDVSGIVGGAGGLSVILIEIRSG